MSSRPLATLQRSRWKCPGCGCGVIVEITEEAVVYTRIEGLDENEELIFGPHTSVDVGRANGYECAACGAPVRDGAVEVSGRQALTELLKRHL